MPVTGAQLMMERLKEVAYHTRQLSKKKVPCENNNNNNNANQVESSVSGQLNKERTSSDSEASWGDQSDGNSDMVNSGAEHSDNATGVVISRSIGGSDTSSQSGPLPGAIIGEIPGVNVGPLRAEEPKASGSRDKQPEKLSQVANSYQSVLGSVKTPRWVFPCH